MSMNSNDRQRLATSWLMLQQTPEAGATREDLAWVVEPRHVEVTALFAAAGALLLLVGAGLSLSWYGRVV